MSEEQKGRLTMGVTRLYEKVPPDRIGVLIGHEGKIKEELMRRTRTIITIDSTTGTVIIEPASPTTTALELMKARDVVRAIAYGFSPERAFRLLDEDQVLLVIDLKQYVGDRPNHLQRVKGRIIGEGGKARRIIEEMTGTYISVYKNYVAIIGDFESANIAKTAIELLIEGRRHSTVYRYIERETFLEKRKKMRQLWKEKI
ncbi:KH, type 1, domain protein [Staphylothermus marinus F1]|uniref:KH, type 1, domain protein n=1 Tax=Staphylothermus marinus (strain ATCC 43588 / DSM 3639 / JCM 9404 / F1) TaxID=399550 RepID=A3DNJ3_STAMF|nr:KH domain-containing protein [Staphylothermus marinus]ABN70203.1 KH, type 1, domain protein [Staphylothermus marinus F1]